MGKMILLVVMGSYYILGSFMINNNNTSSDTVDNVIGYYTQIKLKNIAASGANIGVSKIYRDHKFRGNINNIAFSQGSIDLKIIDKPSIGPNGVEIISIAEYLNFKDSVIIEMTLQAFNQYVWFTDEFSSSGYFGTGHVFDGPFHSNQKININGDAIFKGKVTLGEGPINIKSGDPEFWGGIEYVGKINMPGNLDGMKLEAVSGGFSTNKELWIDFNGTDKITYYHSVILGIPVLPQTVSLSSFAPNGLIYSEKDIHVKGNFDGSITLSTKENIWIKDNVGVVEDPRTNPNSDQVIGLCAEKKIIIDDNPVFDIKKNVEIVAAIYAGDKLEAENYGSRPKGTLTIYGSRTQKKAGFIGSGSNGFVSKNHFDSRFYTNKYPPSYPLTDRMKIVSWWE